MASVIQEYWSSFREELVATSLVLVVAVGGSFFILNHFLNPRPSSGVATGVAVGPTGTVLGNQMVVPTVTVVPTATPYLVPLSPTVNPFDQEVTYGTSGLYETDQYRLALDSPRIVFDTRDQHARKFLLDVTLVNKTVTSGLPNNLACTIIKDGTVIVPTAAMSLSAARVLMPGESVTYQARLSLIEGTDISLVLFKPAGIGVPVEHILRP